jgi:23S rRNA G2445 N2-methylase RlmL
VLAESLGKIGSSAAAGALARYEGDDAELRRIVAKAVLRLERDRVREETSVIDTGASLDRPWPVVYRCREGLESILVEELGASASPRAIGEGRVQAVLRGSLSASRMPRTAASFAFLLGPASGQDEAALAEGLLSSEAAWTIFRTFTKGPIRFRLAFEGAGHRRGLVHRVAERVRAARPEVLNDPTGSTWEALVREAREPTKANLRTIAIELEPRALVDARFDYRVADVPAASHPTIAAALARVAGVRADDVVWDPFVGSALELIERARLGPYARIIGTDVDEGALESARANVARAGVERVELVHADSTQNVPEGVTLVLTNPPMGRRVARGELAPLMDKFVHAAREALGSARSGGRLVWLSPMPDRTRARLQAAGFTIEVARPVDMGGFRAELQRATIPPWPGAASAGSSSSARRSSA